MPGKDDAVQAWNSAMNDCKKEYEKTDVENVDHALTNYISSITAIKDAIEDKSSDVGSVITTAKSLNLQLEVFGCTLENIEENFC